MKKIIVTSILLGLIAFPVVAMSSDCDIYMISGGRYVHNERYVQALVAGSSYQGAK